MSDSLLVGMFAFLVFAPCVAAFIASRSPENVIYVDKFMRPRRRGAVAAPLQAMFAEASLAEDFEIRSFPKGLSQRRIVIRDAEDGVKLTIAQVRAAAIELYKLGGFVAAYEFALVAAKSAAAMDSMKDAFAIAAHEAMEAARNAYAWFAWGDALTREHTETTIWDTVWDQAPPKFAPRSVRLDSGEWLVAARAA